MGQGARDPFTRCGTCNGSGSQFVPSYAPAPGAEPYGRTGHERFLPANTFLANNIKYLSKYSLPQ